jgi:hypothetical protein
MNIEFVTLKPELLEDELTLPKTTNKFIPEWYKKMPLQTHPSNFIGGGTIKSCPGLTDLFGLGYILPAWADFAFYYNKETVLAKAGKDNGQVEHHSNKQFLDYVEHNYLGKEGKSVFKLINPWQIITPKGWSILQIPLFYHFHKDFSVLPGIMDTDIWHQPNIQVMYYGSDEIVIPKGTPLVQYIPFKREQNKLVIRAADNVDMKRFKNAEEEVFSVFSRGYLNRRKRKNNA